MGEDGAPDSCLVAADDFLDADITSHIATYGTVPNGALDGIIKRWEAALANANSQRSSNACRDPNCLDGAWSRVCAAKAAEKV